MKVDPTFGPLKPLLDPEVPFIVEDRPSGARVFNVVDPKTGTIWTDRQVFHVRFHDKTYRFDVAAWDRGDIDADLCGFIE